MKRISLFLLILILVIFPSSVFADVAPPYNPPGTNPQPGIENTQVRMAAETVLVNVLNDTKAGSLGSARVTVDFTMRNEGQAEEKMAVRFPISASDGRGEFPEIADITIKVIGNPVNFRRVDYPVDGSQENPLSWAEFNVAFPAGKDTAIQVSYSLRGTGYPPYTAFFYVLETGAGWKGTIGSADITLRLPYTASPQNVVQDMQIGWGETTRGGIFQGNEVRWHYEDFEPGPDGAVANMEFALVSPAAWNAVLTERKNIASNPGDGEAWGRLGRAYKQIFLMGKGYRSDPGGEELYQLGIEAYETCLSIKPDDAQWHAGFADMLINRSYWDAWGKGPSADTYRGLEEIRTALKLAPNDPKVKEIALNLSYMFPDGMVASGSGYDFPWLTTTPTAIPPTATIVPAFDPATLFGTYTSGMMTFTNQKTARITMTLQPDHLVLMNIMYEKEPQVTSNGTWLDFGDGTIVINIFDPDHGNFRYVFKVDNNQLKAVEYPTRYSDEGMLLTKTSAATPAPDSVNTPQPEPAIQHAAVATATPTPAPEPISPPPAPTSAPRSGFPACGSALLPIAGIAWVFTRKVLQPRKR